MYDIIIIGGGAIGASISRRLSKYNIKIALLEKNVEICQETTKANSAIVHGGYDNKPGTLKARLNVRGNEMYGELARELEFEYKPMGSLVLAFNPEEEEVLEELCKRGKENGVRGLSIISGEEVREMEPFVSEQVTSALYCSSAGVVDPFNYTYAMMENAMENGVELFTEREVLDLEKGEDHITIKTDKEEFKTKYVINAAGLNSGKVANMAGDYDFEILPTRGVYRLLAKDRYKQLEKVLFQTPSKKGKGVLVTSTYDGNTMIGPTSERISDIDLESDEEYSLEMLDQMGKKSVPNLDVKKTIRIFTGIRAKPDTGDFMIYPSENMKGVVQVGGIESPGLASAPAIAEYVEDILKEIGFESEVKSDYNPKRKGIIRMSKLEGQDKEAKIEEDEKFGQIICRCERVSEGEILEAIHRPAGAVTVDGVKRRVRAGMGFCQGNYCRPRVEAILARELDIEKDEIKEELKGSEMVENLIKNKEI